MKRKVTQASTTCINIRQKWSNSVNKLPLGSLIARAPTCSPLISFRKRDSQGQQKEVNDNRANSSKYRKLKMEGGEISVMHQKRASNIQFNSIYLEVLPLFHHSLIHSNYHDWSNYDLIMDYTKHGKFSYKKPLVLANQWRSIYLVH